MIFYFSGTGNSEWTAQKIAEKTSDKAYDIVKLKELPEIDGEQQIGFVFPVYAWGAAEPHDGICQKTEKNESFHFRGVHLRRKCRKNHEKIFCCLSS